MDNKITPGPWKWFNDGDLANEEGKMVLRPDANRGIPTDADAKLIASAPDLLAERDRLLLQNREYLDHIEWAWGVIANAGPEGCLGNWKKLDAEWVEIAENWREKYHKILDERRESLKRKGPIMHVPGCEGLNCNCKPVFGQP